MASYRVEFVRSAEKDLRDITSAMIPRIIAAAEGLASEPRPHGCVKLAGATQTFRIRVGDYRVVYDVDDANSVVTVSRIRHRREVYR